MTHASFKLYRYVGPAAIRDRAILSPPGVLVKTVADVVAWVRDTRQEPSREGLYAATFVVDEQAELRVADRNSEHVACSRGGPVLSAGEMFFRVNRGMAEVVEVTNQSTGFCPDPESWPAVAAALDRRKIPHPGRFTTAFIFRMCQACGQRNLVKDGWYVCGVCGADLPATWNLGDAADG